MAEEAPLSVMDAAMLLYIELGIVVLPMARPQVFASLLSFVGVHQERTQHYGNTMVALIRTDCLLMSAGGMQDAVGVVILLGWCYDWVADGWSMWSVCVVLQDVCICVAKYI